MADPTYEQSHFLSCSVQEKHEQEESEDIGHIGVEPAVMHARQKSGYPLHGRTDRLEEQAVHHMRFLALPVNGSAEMHRDSLTGVLRDVGLKDRLKDHAHRIGKSRRGVGHLRQKTRNSASPECAPRQRSADASAE